MTRYSSPLITPRATFQDPQWMPETTDSTQPIMYTYICFPLYLHSYGKVYERGTVRLTITEQVLTRCDERGLSLRLPRTVRTLLVRT